MTDKLFTSSKTGASLIAGAKSEEILEPNDEASAIVIKHQDARKVILSSTLTE